MQDKHHIDEMFNRALNNFEADPPEGAWENIANGLFDQGFQQGLSGLEETPSLPFEAIEAHIEPVNADMANAEFDSVVRHKLKGIEREPSPGVWTNIRRYIPLSLLVRQSLTQLSKIAGILLIGLFIVFVMGYLGVIDRIQDFMNPPQMTEPQALLEEKIETASSDKETAAILTLDADIQENNILTEKKAGVINAEVQHEHIQTSVASEILSHQSASEQLNQQFATNDLQVAGDLQLNNTNNINAQRVAAPIIVEEVVDQILENETEAVNLRQEAVISLPVLQSEKLLSIIPLQAVTAIPYVTLEGDEFKNMERTNLEKGNHLSRKMDNLLVLDVLTYTGPYFNLYAQINNTWVLNDDIRKEVSSGGTADYVLDIGAAYGAGLGFQLNPRLAFEANWMHARQGQRYQEFTEAGIYKTTELNTTYNYFPVWLKIQALRMKDSGNKAMTWNYKVGMHYGRLDAAILKTGREGVAFSENLIKNELGIDMGLEMRLFIDPKFFVSIGAHGSYGVEAAILTGHSPNKTANVNFGLQLGVHYRLRR